jgi:poly-gamma-glutamate synthesis protein (capsule biosynthesis protein)
VDRLTEVIFRRFPRVFAAAAALIIGAAAANSQDAALDIRPVPSRPMPDGFTLAAVGDFIMLRPMLPTIEAQSPELVRLIRNADAAFANFEMMAIDLRKFRGSPQAESGGTWMIGAPNVPADVKAMGFDLVGLANNHTTDWGVEGLAETERRLADAGIIHAGTGPTLGAARSPSYYDGAKGRVALVSAASSFTPMSRAADPLGDVPGRAGLNALRTERTVLLPPEELEALRQVAAKVNGEKASGSFRFFGTRFAAEDPGESEPRFSYALDTRDLSGNLLAIRQGKQNSNFAIFSLHNHEPGNDSDVPADFAIEMAHRAIDEGADAYVGHGPHILRGIEIYKGKPIFYSLGNFAMMNNSLDAVPAEMYEQYGVTPGSATVPEMLQARAERVFSDPRQYESVIALSRYVGGRVAEIRLYPIDLGVGVKGAAHGVPAMADAAEGRKILERLQALSKPFGTVITIEKGVGVIRSR